MMMMMKSIIMMTYVLTVYDRDETGKPTRNALCILCRQHANSCFFHSRRLREWSRSCVCVRVRVTVSRCQNTGARVFALIAGMHLTKCPSSDLLTVGRLAHRTICRFCTLFTNSLTALMTSRRQWRHIQVMT